MTAIREVGGASGGVRQKRNGVCMADDNAGTRNWGHNFFLIFELLHIHLHSFISNLIAHSVDVCILRQILALTIHTDL